MKKKTVVSLLERLVFIATPIAIIGTPAAHAEITVDGVKYANVISSDTVVTGPTDLVSTYFGPGIKFDGNNQNVKVTSSGQPGVLYVSEKAILSNIKNFTVSPGGNAGVNNGTIEVTENFKTEGFLNNGTLSASLLDLSSGAYPFTNNGKLILTSGSTKQPESQGSYSTIVNNGVIEVLDGKLEVAGLTVGEKGTLTDGNGGLIDLYSQHHTGSQIKVNSQDLKLNKLVVNGQLGGVGNITTQSDSYIANFELEDKASYTGQGATTIYQGTVKNGVTLDANQLAVGQLTIQGKISVTQPLLLSGSVKESGHTSIEVKNGGGDKFQVKDIHIQHSKRSGYVAFHNGNYELKNLILERQGSESAYSYTGFQLYATADHPSPVTSLSVNNMQIGEKVKGLVNFYENSSSDTLKANISTLSVKKGGQLFLNAQEKAGENHVVEIKEALFEENSSITNKKNSKTTHAYIENLIANGMNVKTSQDGEGLLDSSTVNIKNAAFVGGINDFQHEISGLTSLKVQGSDTKVSFNSLTTDTLSTLEVGEGTQLAIHNPIVVNSGFNSGNLSVGGLTVDGTFEVSGKVNVHGNDVYLTKDSTLVYVPSTEGPLFSGTGQENFVSEEGSKILIKGSVSTGEVIPIAGNFNSVNADLMMYEHDSRLYTLVKDPSSSENEFRVMVIENSDFNIYEGGLMPAITAAAASNEALGADRIVQLLSRENGLTDSQVKASINNIALMGTASGAQTLGMNASNMLLDVVETHGSSLSSYSHRENDPDIWIDVAGSFSKASSYTAGNTTYGYKSDLSGVTIGADYVFSNNLTTGIAVSFGKGSVRGQGQGAGIKNEANYYGTNLYSSWKFEGFNTVVSLGYLQSRNKIKSQGFQGKPNVKVISAGVRLEKPFVLNEALTATPHLGLRYKHIKMDSFKAGGFGYSSGKANLAELPVGVALSGNLQSPGGAQVKPFVDIAVVPILGQKKVKTQVELLGTTIGDSFDARITNNAIYRSKIGVDASYRRHSLGFNYEIGGGSDGRVDQALKAQYRYAF